MHINNDCIRDILFTIEDNSTYSKACCMRQATETYPKLKTYDSEAISYHLRYLEMKGFIFKPQPKFYLTMIYHLLVMNFFPTSVIITTGQK